MATATQLIPVQVRWLLRAAIALVWLYQGLWHKLLAVDERHRRIVTEALGTSFGSAALSGIGLFETLLAIGVLCQFKPVLVAWSQILLLAIMNAVGLLSASHEIPDPIGMMTMNFVFCIAIWINGQLSAKA